MTVIISDEQTDKPMHHLDPSTPPNSSTFVGALDERTNPQYDHSNSPLLLLYENK